MNDTLYISVESVTATNPGTILLGISLTVLPGSLPIGNAMKPWLWDISGWVVVASKDGTAWSMLPANPANVPPIYKHLDLPGGDDNSGIWSNTIAASKAALEDAIIAINKGPAGPVAGDPLQSINFNDKSLTPAAHKYLSLLINTAAGPYPIPQNLNLSFFVEVGRFAAVPDPTIYKQFLVAPIFTASGVKYDPSGQSVPTSPVWKLTVSGLDMNAQFSTPDATPAIPASLWIPPVPVGTAPLVSDWSAIIYDVTGPYLDLAHVFPSLDDDHDIHGVPVLSTVLPLSNWPIFRLWVMAGLHDLVTAPLPPEPEPWLNKWCATLRKQLGGDFAQLPALNPEDQSIRTYNEEIDDVRRIVSAATRGETLLSLVKSFLNSSNSSAVPSRLLTVDAAAQLLSWLQVQLALPYSNEITAACTVDPTNFRTIATGLFNNPISPRLEYRAKTGLDPFPKGPEPAWVQGLIQACSSKIQLALRDALSRQAVGKAIGSDGSVSAYAATTDAPPLVIPVMQLRTSGDLTSDPLHGIRGVGVLMRRVKTPAMDWRCLNVVAPAQSTKLPLLVASRLGYNRNLLTGFLPYNNGPLPCENLLHNYLDTDNHLTSAVPTTDNLAHSIAAIFKYAPYEDSASALYGTPMLEAGESYEVACFAVSNSGALPNELRAGYPAKLKPLLAANPLSGAKSTIAYYRAVPVCATEVRDGLGNPVSDSNLFFPKIPQNVWPRAVGTIVSQSGVELPLPPSGSIPAKPSILLVVPSTSKASPASPTVNNAAGTSSTFVFSLKLPDLEAQTWDRTVGYRMADRQIRAQILDNAYRKLANRKKTEITDPLIKGIKFSLYQWAVNPGQGSWGHPIGTASYSVDELRRALTGVESVETFPVQVLVSAGTGQGDGSLQLGILSGTKQASNPKLVGAKSLAEGEVFLLEATLVLDGGVNKIMPGYPHPPAAGAQAPAVVGYQLLIEIASAKMPTDIKKPFSVSAVPINGIPDQMVQVRIKTDPSDSWNNIHRVDYLRQTWSWTGRTQPVLKDPPIYEKNLAPGYFPASQPLDLDSKPVQEWEKIEFAERLPVDRVEFTSVLKQEVFSWDQDLSLDPRAAFLRFAPRVYSRYQGAFAGDNWYVSTTVGNAKRDDYWKRCFLRSRVQALKMPRLKALIPLTESAFAQGTPGILAVFDGPAYEQAGLAERMTVSVATVKDPDPGITTAWSQDGPDFLMSSSPIDPDPKKQIRLKLLPLGPIGHTFDSTESGFPKFTSHSYIIRPVNATDPDPDNPDTGHDFSWWFANLEFQMKIDDLSSVFQGPGIQSQSTVGSWIQFLPGFQNANQSDDFTHCSLQWQPGTIVILDPQGNPIARRRDGERHSRHYVLVTRTVLDITGRNREAYVGVATLNGDKWSLFPDVKQSFNDQSQLHARFLDVRAGEIGSDHDSQPTSDAEFWRRILGGKMDGITDQNRASPVSLSPAIHQKGGS